MNIPSDLMNIANEISQQIENSGMNVCPDGSSSQRFLNDINSVQQNISNGIELMNKVNQLYQKFDRDSDGAITQNDFTILLEQLGFGFVGKHLAKILFKKIDTNRNGKVDLTEASNLIQVLVKLIGDLSKINTQK